MKKLYYDCATSAIYMAKYFGVKFYCVETIEDRNGTKHKCRYDLKPSTMPNKNGLAFACRPTTWKKGASWSQLISSLELSVKINYSDDRKLYIHPDSLSIFELQVGDLMRCGNEIGVVKDFLGPDVNFTDYNCIWNYKETKYKILERNNKPFIMPKVEE